MARVSVFVLAACLPLLSACTAERAADPAPAAVEDWCGGHGLPESKCTKCNPELIPKFKAAGDWCEAHGYPESACPSCNPQPRPGSGGAVQAAAADWCKGHGLPESKCTKCNPELIPKFKGAGDWCEAHGYPESACPVCSPQAAPGAAAPGEGAGTRIRFASPGLEKDVGIAVTAASSGALERVAECTARIDFDRNRVADVRAVVPGIVREVRVDLGARVSAGDVLFVIESTRVGDMQGRLRSALERVEAARSHHQRQKALRESNVSSTRQVELAYRDLEQAQAEVEALQAALRMAGAGKAGGRMMIRAPIDGVVVGRPATLGSLATDEASLATLAETGSMWAVLDLAESDAGLVRLGSEVQVAVDGIPGRSFQGKLAWIAAEVDARTRTVAARAELSNADGLLRANQFARARVALAPPEDALWVPRDALQPLDDEELIFVRTAPGVFEPRVVVAGLVQGGLVQVTGDLRSGEPVVTAGAYLLKTELTKDSIGAGCCEVEERGAP